MTDIPNTFKANGNDMAEPLSDEKFVEMISDPSKLNLIFMLHPPRPGARLFAVKLEYEHYVPGTSDNDKYQMLLTKWYDILWSVISIPVEDKMIAEQVAAEVGMELSETVPFTMQSGKLVKFPIGTSKSVLSVQNKKDSPVYDSYVGMTHVLEMEEAKIETVFADFAKKNGL